MENYFPLYFKKHKNLIERGLSIRESEKSKSKSLIMYGNPRNIPLRSPEYKMTLVWDLDQTLVSADGLDNEDEFDIDTRLVIRPHAREILKILKRNSDVEFIVWTAGAKSHAERVVGSFMDIKFDHIIHRDPSWYSIKDTIKNLNLICNESRPLNSMILIDDRMDIGTEHPENLLVVPPYHPKKHYASDDTTMLYLANILQRAINMYRENLSRKNDNGSIHPFHSYLFSPLSEKCIYDIHTYYGVKCFENKYDLQKRIKSFKKIVHSSL